MRSRSPGSPNPFDMAQAAPCLSTFFNSELETLMSPFWPTPQGTALNKASSSTASFPLTSWAMRSVAMRRQPQLMS